MVPLRAFATFAETSAATSINHQDGELSTTVSFNLAEGRTLAEGQAAVRTAEAAIGVPTNVRGSSRARPAARRNRSRSNHC